MMVTKPDLFHGLCVKEPHDNKNKPMPYALCQSQIMANPDINSRKAWARNANAYLLMCFKAKYFVFVRNWLKAPGIPCSHMASSIQTPYVALLRPWLPFHSTVLYNDHILLVYCKPLSL